MSAALVLASSSPYRRALLEKLGLPFAAESPAIDESPLPHEAPDDLVQRLALAKAQALAPRYPAHWIIGSDQLAVLDGRVLGKPGNSETACEQLRACSGRRVIFLTGLTLLDSASGAATTVLEPFIVTFRRLSDAQIAHYVEREQPLDCAGSFKSEGLGIALFERLQGDDPNALVGLPLIRLVTLLQQAGIAVI